MQTLDMVSMRHLRYNGVDLLPGAPFKALSQTDYEFMINRGRASKAPAGPVEAPVTDRHTPQAVEAVTGRPPGRPSNAQRLANQEASAQSELKASNFTPHN